MTTPDAPFPHADLLAAVRRANPDRMASSMRQATFDEILAAHPDVVLLDSRDDGAGGDGGDGERMSG